MTNVILIDGKNTLFRFGYAHKFLQDSLERPTGVLYGLSGELLRLKRRFSPCQYVVIWDGEGTHKFGWRVAHYPEYKQNRTLLAAAATPESVDTRKRVLAQIDDTKKMLRILCIPQIEVPHLEADDAIALVSFAVLADKNQPVIYSSDKDFMQLIPHGCHLTRLGKADKKDLEDDNTVFTKFQCCSKDVLKVRALTGDPSDGIPSVYKGVGAVRAARLVSDGLRPDLPFEQQPFTLRSFPWLKAGWGTVRRNYTIMTLITNLKDDRLTDKQRLLLKKQINGALSHKPNVNYDELIEFLGEYELQEALSNRKELYQLHA